ncbi:MAG: HAD family hydrolase [Syntrophobacteraceae bacterium]|nr:HAD family hydrolase [Syntrophobacteraceae bacterium]
MRTLQSKPDDLHSKGLHVFIRHDPGDRIETVLDHDLLTFLGENVLDELRAQRIHLLVGILVQVDVKKTSKGIIAAIGVADTVKESSKEAISRLIKMGIDVWMITGDHSRTAAAVARQVGIDQVLAEVTPERKAYLR